MKALEEMDMRYIAETALGRRDVSVVTVETTIVGAE